MLDRCRIACWIAVPVYLWRAWPSAWSTVDDAWISARYAANLVAGNGLVYSVGEPPIEGFTNLLWTLWLAVGIALGAEETAWMTGSGLLFGALCVPLVGEVTRALLPLDVPGTRWPAVVASWIAALDIRHAVASTNGLETSMYTACLLAAVLLALKNRGAILTGLALGALAAVRPEGLLAGLLLLGVGRLERRRLFTTGLALLGVWALLEGWRLSTYGAWLPNTFAAKNDQAPTFHFWRNLNYLSRSWPWWSIAGVSLLVGPWLRFDRRRWILAGIALGSAAAAMKVYLWMPGGRLLVPVAFLALPLLASGCHRRLGQVLLLLWLGIAAASPFTTMDGAERHYDGRHSVAMPNNASRVGTHLRKNLPPGSWMAVRDAGVLAYFFGPEMKIAELHNRALTLPHPGGASTNVYTHTPKNPAVLAITIADPASPRIRYSGDRQIHRRIDQPYTYLGRIHQHYRRYYDVYVRSDLDVPALPKGWVSNRNGPRAPGQRTPSPKRQKESKDRKHGSKATSDP